MTQTIPTRVRLNEFEFNLQTGELRSLGAPNGTVKTTLGEQPFQILKLLVERPGKIVSREEIRRTLWSNDTIVDFDHSINVAIRILRKALGDSADHPRYIETIASRGYRLLVKVEFQETSSGAHLDHGQLESLPKLGDLVGRKVSHYRVLQVLGGGGMGVVYTAEDLRLGRRVALKFLPEEFSSEPAALKRFEREAQTASSLNHPNICTIHAIDEFEGRPFIVMELLDGSTLRDQLAAFEGRPFPWQRILDISIPICKALQAAHEKGIIHRDIKPANIFLTRDGTPKILDFGLAKLVAEETISSGTEQANAEEQVDGARPPTDSTLTWAGNAAGTAGYMSPEQIRRETLDDRTDLFSFGLVLYEMATGQRAFPGDDPVAVREALLDKQPVSVRRLNPSFPPSLEAVIEKALRKNRDARYQSAQGLRVALEAVREPHRSWRKVAIRFLLGTAALATAVLTFVYWRSHTRFRLAANDAIVIADTTNQTSDPVLSDAINTALQVEFAQTPFFQVLAQDKIRQTMQSLKFPVDASVTPDVALKVCLSTNSKAVIASEIEDEGNRFHIQLAAINCQSGTILAKAHGDASTRDQIIHQLGIAAASLRRLTGEPSSSIAQYNTPLEIATSSSPEALLLFSQGVKLFYSADTSGTATLFQRAVQIDPSFALAYLGLGSMYEFEGKDQLFHVNEQRAFELRNRLTTHDRLLAESNYDWLAAGDLDKALLIIQQWIEEFPTDVRGRVNFAGCLLTLGRLDEAVVQAREAVRLWPAQFSYHVLIQDLVIAQRNDEALTAFRDSVSRHLDDATSHEAILDLAEAQENDAGINEQMVWARDNPENLSDILSEHAWWEYNRGRLRHAIQLIQEANAAAKNAGGRTDNSSFTGDAPLSSAWIYAEMGDPQAAKEILHRFLAQQNNPLTRRQTVYLALALARSGNASESEKYVNTLKAELPFTSAERIYDSGMLYAAIELEQNHSAEAVQTLEPVRHRDFMANLDSPSGLIPSYLRGLAYLKLGDGRSAAAEFQKLIDHPNLVSLGFACLNSLARLQLARAQVLEGDRNGAKKTYEQFLALWKDADPNIPILRQAKAEYAALH